MSILHYYLGRPAHVWIAMSRRSPASPDRPRPSRYPLAISGEGFEDLVDSLGADERPGSISACPAQPAFVPELGRFSAQGGPPARESGEPASQLLSPRRTVDDTAASPGLAGRSSAGMPRASFMAAS